MAHPITVERFHAECVKFYEHSPRIPYSTSGGANYTATDCRGVVLGAVRNAGYKEFRFAGTNDFWDNYCKWRGTPAEAKALGYWKPGLILFHLDESAGRTTHMGVLTDRRKTLYPDIEKRATGDIINSSESKNGMILSDTNDKYYNRCALAKDSIIDYSGWFGVDAADMGNPVTEPETTVSANPAALYQAMIRTDETGLNFRRTPSKDSGRVEGMKVIPRGATVHVLEEVNAEWAKVAYQGYVGYVHRDFLVRVAGGVEPADTAALVVEIYAYQGGIMDSAAAGAILSVAQTMGYTGTIRERDD